MINLIPKEEKKRMIVDFYYRLAVLFFGTLSFCVLISLISLLPSYFISITKDTLSNTRLETQKQEPLPVIGAQSLATIKDVNSKLDLVEKSQENKFPPSLKVINAILTVKRSDIKITRILYENNGTTARKISIIGLAPSREVLLLFRKALEDSPNFKNVNLPISNFVKGSNIEFYLTLVPA